MMSEDPAFPFANSLNCWNAFTPPAADDIELAWSTGAATRVLPELLEHTRP